MASRVKGGNLEREWKLCDSILQHFEPTLLISLIYTGVFVDGTFGRGGHTKKIIEAMGPSGMCIRIVCVVESVNRTIKSASTCVC